MSTPGSPDWAHMNVPAIWALLDADNLEHAANRPNDWDNLSTALDESKRRLDAAAEQLETVWPSSANQSAQSFQDQISLLSGSMQETLTKASSTTSGLNGVITALSTAKDKVAKLQQERESKSHDIVPRWIDHAEDHLDTQAQEAMREAEAAVADHSTAMQPPLLYQMTVGTENIDDHKVGNPPGHGSGASALRAEPIAVTTPAGSSFDYPVTGGDAGTGTGPGSTGHSGSGSASTPPGGLGAGASGSTGPILSGVAPTVPSPTAPLPSTGAAGLPTGVSGSAGGLPSGLGVLPIGAGALNPGVGGIGAVSGLSGRAETIGVRRPVPVRRALPSGAVIGEESERGIGARGSAPGESPMGGAGRGGRGKRSDDETLTGEAELLWQTREGVAPVIEPDRSPERHDPGPGVIGYSR